MHKVEDSSGVLIITPVNTDPARSKPSILEETIASSLLRLGVGEFVNKHHQSPILQEKKQ